MYTLNDLGQKICVIGCSNSGKSTLAAALGNKLKIPTYHLDQYAHQSNTNWQRKSDTDLITEHNKMLQAPAWIIEGNYSVCMIERFNQASSIIWLDLSPGACVWRYIKRSIFNKQNRPGKLAGSQQEFAWWLVKWILFQYPKNRLKYENLLKSYLHLPVLHIKTMTDLKALYQRWELLEPKNNVVYQ